MTTRSITLNFALLDLLFSLISSLFGRIGFFVNILHGIDYFIISLNVSFTIRSSKEWKLITQSFPPIAKRLKILGRTCFKTLSSSLTAILNAWKTWVAGFLFQDLSTTFVLGLVTQ